MNQVKLQSADILNYILAGKAIFTLHNPGTGNQFTYKVNQPKDCGLHFVKVLTGPENTSDYSYIGFIKNGRFIHGRAKSRIGQDAPSVKAIGWLLDNLNRLGPVEVLPSTHCCRCGRLLTTPESTRQFYGPECIKYLTD